VVPSDTLLRKGPAFVTAIIIIIIIIIHLYILTVLPKDPKLFILITIFASFE